MIDRDRGLKLLGAGLGPTDVATTLGCDPSLISQWLMDDAFRNQVLALRLESLQAQTNRDRKIDALEDSMIQKLEELVPYMTNMKQILQAFQLLNSAKRRGAASTGQITIQQQVVSLNMPPVAKEFFFPKTNAQGEVVQVGDQVTVTKSLQSLMQERLKQRKLTSQDAEVLSHGSPKEASAAGSTAERREQAPA